MFANQRNHRRSWRQWAISLLFPVLAYAAEPNPASVPRLLDRAVASIDGKAITASQLDFEARVLLVNAGGVSAAFSPLDQPVLESSLRLMIDQRLAVQEADKLEAYPLDPGELEKAIAEFRARFDSESAFIRFLDAHEAELGDLAEVLRRNLRSQRALEGKLRLRAQVSEAEARTYQTAHPELKSMEQARALLTQKKFGDLVKQELQEQRRQSDVRLLGPFAPKPSGGP